MKISIITVNRNDAAGLHKTILSVAAQTAKPWQFIVIDGASDDGFLPETGTMAEIYAGQGHYEQAIRIYRDKLERDPSDERAAKRIAELEELLRRKKEGE